MEKQKASTIFLHVCERSRQQASAPATSDELNSIMKGDLDLVLKRGLWKYMKLAPGLGEVRVEEGRESPAMGTGSGSGARKGRVGFEWNCYVCCSSCRQWRDLCPEASWGRTVTSPAAPGARAPPASCPEDQWRRRRRGGSVLVLWPGLPGFGKIQAAERPGC